MRGGILIIGSLRWDNGPRNDWRGKHLRVDDGIHVKLPIRYRRLSESRGYTYTMTFVTGAPDGQGVLAPCKDDIPDVAGLIAEAEALWKAEQSTAPPHRLGASWGCVGALFCGRSPPPDWLKAWTKHFRANASSPIWPVGILARLKVSQRVWASFSRPRRLRRSHRPPPSMLPMRG
jgi:hypothetical protein